VRVDDAGAAGFSEAGSKREIPAAAASAMSAAHCEERKEHGEENMTGESWYAAGVCEIGATEDSDEEIFLDGR
jgi:hypothetical protein